MYVIRFATCHPVARPRHPLADELVLLLECNVVVIVRMLAVRWMTATKNVFIVKTEVGMAREGPDMQG